MTDRPTIGDQLAAARARLDRLPPERAREAQAEGAIIVDTRCREDRVRTGMIPGAIPIALSVLPWRVDPTSGHADPRLTDPERRLVLVCNHSYSSSIAAAMLHDLGYPLATDLEGGMEAWLEAGLPTEPVAD